MSASVNIIANASDNVGVAGVHFRVDGNVVGAEDTTAPYSLSWNSATATNGVHSLTAVARDAAGNTSTSTAISVTVANVVDTTAPSISLTAPVNNSTASGTVAVSASASDNIGVTGVQFKLDGNNVGAEDTTPPYSVVWDSTTAANGVHTLTAVARDAAGNSSTSAPVSITVSNSITQPTGLIAAFNFDAGAGLTAADSSGNNYNGTLTNGPVWITGRVNGALRFNATDDGNDNNDPRVVLGRTSDIPNLPFSLSAWVNPVDYADWRAIFSKRDSSSASDRRLDVGLNISTGRVYVFSAPSVTESSYAPPVNAWSHLAVVASPTGTQLFVNGVLNQTLGAITLGSDGTANAVIGGTGEGTNGDNDPFKGAIDELRIYGSALTPAQVQALYNASGATDTTAPTVSITAPANNAAVSGNSVAISATAGDNVGVAGVQFRLDGNNLGAEDTTSPYSATWDSTTAGNGDHTLTAVARDAAGNTTNSAPVSITVDNAALSTLTCVPAALITGASATCAVTATVAPSGAGLTVNLSSGNATALPVPASVTVPAGSTSRTFTVTASLVASPQAVVVTASSNGVNRTAPVTVQPFGLSCTPATLTTPASATCTITLGSAAPAGGSVVQLVSNDRRVTVPATVTVQAGQTRAGFRVGARAAASATNQAVITASLGSRTVSFTFTLFTP